MTDQTRTSMRSRTTSMRGRTVDDAASRRTLTASVARPGDRTRGLTPNPADHVRAKRLRDALLVERAVTQEQIRAGRR